MDRPKPEFWGSCLYRSAQLVLGAIGLGAVTLLLLGIDCVAAPLVREAGYVDSIEYTFSRQMERTLGGTIPKGYVRTDETIICESGQVITVSNVSIPRETLVVVEYRRGRLRNYGGRIVSAQTKRLSPR